MFTLILKAYRSSICSGIANMDHLRYKKQLLQQFFTSVAGVDPVKLVLENLKLEEENLHVCGKVYNLNHGDIYLVGFGKAVLSMAYQCEKILGQRLKRGIICVPKNTGKTCYKNFLDSSRNPASVIEVHEGARNNLPDEDAEKGADKIIKLAESLPRREDNHFIVLISGGGSALFPKPKDGITLAEKLNIIKQIASSGGNITELNSVRKKLSKTKGGGLASMLYPLKTICLILSDIINDPLDMIASGPTVPNLNLGFSATDVIKKYNLENKVPKDVLSLLEANMSNFSVPIVNNAFPHVDNFIIGNNSKALSAGKQYMEECGFKTVILSKKVEGLVETVSNFYLNMLLEIVQCLQSRGDLKQEKLLKGCHFDCEENFTDDLNRALKDSSDARKICVIAGGETTVKLQGDGKGGRSQELTLIMSMGIYDLKRKHPNLFEKYSIIFLMAGTDGIDGPTDAAGAIGEASVIEKAKKSNLDANSFLMKSDSYNFFQRVDNGSYLIKTGPTGTNVMDIHSFLIYESLEIRN